jgi:hypothetical protein
MLTACLGYTHDAFQLQLQRREQDQRSHGCCWELGLYILSICLQRVVHMLTMVVAMCGGVGRVCDRRVIEIRSLEGHAGHMLSVCLRFKTRVSMCYACAGVVWSSCVLTLVVVVVWRFKVNTSCK